jgi:hypothetical protein
LPAVPTFSRHALALLVSLVACTSDEWPPLDEGDTGTSEGGDASSDDGTTADAFGDVHLEVFEPQGASIHLLGEPVPLLAELRDEDDLPVDFGDVVWTSEDGGPTLLEGLEGEAMLAPGIHDIAAIARLPNGDRLETKIADVRVQSRWTGRYEGDVTMVLSAEFQGIPFTSVCESPLQMEVGFDGDTFEVEPGSCMINAVIATFDATWVLEGELDSGIGSGVIRYDLAGFFELELPWTGAFIEDGFGGSFDGTASVPLVGDVPVQGTLAAVLTTPYVDPGE